MSTYLEEAARLIYSQLSPDAGPPPDSESLFILYAALMRAKGESVSLSDVHDVWAAWMILRGESHDSVVPFDMLPEAIQAEDRPYLDAIRRAARIVDKQSS